MRAQRDTYSSQMRLLKARLADYEGFMNIYRLVIKSILLFGAICFAVSGWSNVSDNVKNATRPDTDTSRDEGRKPAAVVQFLGLQEGAVAIDLMALGGYYTEVLSHAVGGQGRVYAQNAPMMLEFRDGYYGKLLSERLNDSRLGNVVRIDRDIDDLGIPAGSVDLAFTALNFHDIYNSAGEKAALQFLSNVYAVLKPGGVLGIIDHAGNTGADNNSLHRMDEAALRAVIEKSEFNLDGASDILRSAQDDRSGGVFSADMRGKTDRFLLRLKKS